MAANKSKYSRAVIKHLRVLSTPNDESLEYGDAYLDFITLWEELGEAFKHGQVTDEQRDLIDTVFNCIGDVVDKGAEFRWVTDEDLMSHPDWEPMREAARAAITKLEG